MTRQLDATLHASIVCVAAEEAIAQTTDMQVNREHKSPQTDAILLW
jgi:hypothetical protein